MSNQSAEIDWRGLEGRQIVSAFFAGILLALLTVLAGFYLNPEGTMSFTAGRYQILFVALFIGLSTGHYFGLSLGSRMNVNVAAATGAFLTISASFIGVMYFGGGFSALAGPGGLLVIATFLLILGHYSGLLSENKPVEEWIERFAQRYSPILLAFIWLLETVMPAISSVVLPIIGLSEIGDALLTGFEVAAVLIGIGIAVYVISHLQNSTQTR